MTLRERIADWISGGALTRSREAETRWHDTAHSLARDNDVLRSGVSFYRKMFRCVEAEAARDPSRPSIKRIARIAKEALE